MSLLRHATGIRCDTSSLILHNSGTGATPNGRPLRQALRIYKRQAIAPASTLASCPTSTPTAAPAPPAATSAIRNLYACCTRILRRRCHVAPQRFLISADRFYTHRCSPLLVANNHLLPVPCYSATSHCRAARKPVSIFSPCCCRDRAAAVSRA